MCVRHMDRDWRSTLQNRHPDSSDNGGMNHRFISTSFDFDGKVVTINTGSGSTASYDKWYHDIPLLLKNDLVP
ncbi:DUF2850 domain-containing protein [Vibrio lentus]|nr:DUF2850 domain-containing protein [Vibrio lentus]